MDKGQIIEKISEHIRTRGVLPGKWYLGISQYPEGRLLVDHKLDMDGIDLLPWDRLPDSYKKHKGYEVPGSPFELKWTSAALVRKIVLPKRHVSDGEKCLLLRFDDSELKDAVLCIGLVGPFVPEVFISWLEPPPWVPVIGAAFYRPFSEGRFRHDVLTDDQFKSASRLFETFRGLSAERKDVLRLPTQRLSMAMRGSSDVDSAVDLGIALEALFLKNSGDDRGELRFRLRLRAARYLGQDIERRNMLFQLVGDLYDLRSRAAHTALVPNIKGKPTPEILLEGFRLTAEAIRRFIAEGDPNWEKIQPQ